MKQYNETISDAYPTVWPCSTFSLSNKVHFISNSSFSLSHSIRLSFSLLSLSITLKIQMRTREHAFQNDLLRIYACLF